MPVKQGFKSFYLYSAVEPSTGKDFTLIMPHVNTENMNEFLKELAKEISGNMILVMDGAGWHKSKDLKIPNNIEIMMLPPYSPELNPVEKLWQYIKNNIMKNQIFESLIQLEESLTIFLKSISTDIVKSICKMVNH